MSTVPIISNPHKIITPLHADPVDGILQTLGNQKGGGSRPRSSNKKRKSHTFQEKKRSKNIKDKRTLKQRLQRRLFV
jgi:hypothetical protein